MGASYDSNIDELESELKSAFASFGLDAPSRKAATVGNRCAETIAQGIHDRGMNRQGPNGEWAPNAPSTIKKKGRDAPNRDTEVMLSTEQIAGEVTVSREEMDVIFGKDAETKAKGFYAEEGQGRTGIVREFFWITESDADAALDGLCDDLMNHLARG